MMFKFDEVETLLVRPFCDVYDVHCCSWIVKDRQRFNCVFRRDDRKLRGYINLGKSSLAEECTLYWEVWGTKKDGSSERVCHRRVVLKKPSSLESALRKALKQLVGQNPFFAVNDTWLRNHLTTFQSRFGGKGGHVKVHRYQWVWFSSRSADDKHSIQGKLTLTGFEQNMFSCTIRKIDAPYPCVTSTKTVFSVEQFYDEMEWMFARLAVISERK